MKMQSQTTKPFALLLSFALLFFAQGVQAKKQEMYIFNGDNPGDRFGFSVSGAGDVDADGYDDLIIGTYIGSTKVLSGASGNILYAFNGDSADDYFGWSVSGAGDVNNDGYADVIVGAHLDDNNGENSGSARVLSGASGNILYTFNGDDEHGYFGWSVSGAGDVNNDGYTDVIIGADNDNNIGSAKVFSGMNGNLIHTFYGIGGGNQFGSVVSGAGDVDNDGYDDLIVGAEGYNSYRGYIKVFSGSSGAELYTFVGKSTYSFYGHSVSDAGDVDNDGHSDFIVGAYSESDKGVVRVYSGKTGSVLHTFNGSDSGGHFGSAVSGAGDVNNDGYDDLIVGAHTDDNHGTSSGTVTIFDGVTGSVMNTFNGDDSNDWFGQSVSGVGDINNDGYADVIVGAHSDENNGFNSGSVRVFSGKKLFSIKNDFTNDGNAGWVWKGESNGLEGSSRTWSADWSSASPGWVPPQRTFPPFWSLAMDYDIETTGDFDGDGDADWLWRGRSDGRWKIWEIESGTRVGQTTPPDFDASHDYTVVGTGDTDKDGDDDVFLNNTSTGEILIWQMENNVIMNTHTVGTKAGYEVVRVGDFDGDYDQDLLLQLSGGNTLRFWEIENNAFVAEHSTPQTGSGFATQCAGDFNGDGNDDVYLLAGDGTSKWFHYVDFVRQAQIFGANQSAWTFYGCGDYDGDGDADMLWTSADGLGINKLFMNQNFNNSATYYFNRYGGTNPANPGYGYEYRGNGN